METSIQRFWRLIHGLGVVACFVLGAAPAFAQDAGRSSQDKLTVVPSLQVRPRTEAAFADTIAGKATEPKYRTTQRTRAQLNVSSDMLNARVSVQDVRKWGSEASSLNDTTADGLDVHEAWGEFVAGKYAVRAGRQELTLDGHRLIGNVDWAQQARSFDGIRLSRSTDLYSTLFFAARVQEGAVSADGKLDGDGKTRDLLVWHTNVKLRDDMALSVPLIYETRSALTKSERDGFNTERLTGGVYVKSTKPMRGIDWRVEAYLQGGKRGLGTGSEQSIFAYMAGARVGYTINQYFAPLLWIDYLSGDDPNSDTYGAFDTLYATNHKFYGFADLFLNIPLHAMDGGLVDIALKNTAPVGPGKLHAALHQFLLARETRVVDGTTYAGVIAAELDLVYTVPVTSYASVQAGFSGVFDEGDFAAGKTKKFHDFAWLQVDIQI